MTKFTQGKWYWQKNILLSPEKIILGAMLLPPLPANARLIAAAPEMYELLKGELLGDCGVLSFAREETVRELLARIDRDEENDTKK